MSDCSRTRTCGRTDRSSGLAGNARYTAHECRRVRAPAAGPSSWRSPQVAVDRQDALLMLCAIFGFGAAIADFRQTRQTIARITNPPLRRRADRAAQLTADLPRPCPGRGQQHDPSTEPHPRLHFVERTSASSCWRSSTVKVISVASGMPRIPTLNHGSCSTDSGY